MAGCADVFVGPFRRIGGNQIRPAATNGILHMPTSLAVRITTGCGHALPDALNLEGASAVAIRPTTTAAGSDTTVPRNTTPSKLASHCRHFRAEMDDGGYPGQLQDAATGHAISDVTIKINGKCLSNSTHVATPLHRSDAHQSDSALRKRGVGHSWRLVRPEDLHASLMRPSKRSPR